VDVQNESATPYINLCSGQYPPKNSLFCNYRYPNQDPSDFLKLFWNLTTFLHDVRVADPDPGSGALLTPGSGMGKKSRSGSENEHAGSSSESLETNFLVKILDADPGSGIFMTLDPG
jgi:hypothetical protein